MGRKGTGVRDRAELKQEILTLVAEYVHQVHEPRPFEPGRSAIRFAGRVFDDAEVTNLVDAALDFWLTAGPNAARLERRLAEVVGVGHCSLVNSGSSANLLAFMALTSPVLGDRRVQRGDEVITVAAGFPTTVAPIVQHGAVPVFVDVRPDTVNIDVSQLEAALSPRTKAVMVAHTLGNPFDIDAVLRFCHAHDLWLVEDNCDALGSMYTSQLGGGPRTGRTGSFGHLATSSFYPAHHITTGEGGAVFTDDEQLAAAVDSFRDWGRDCWCASGKDNTCGQRFAQSFGTLPPGYDHKYVYSHFGYNLKMTDLQAAIGLAQIEKLDGFTAARKQNFALLAAETAPFADTVRIMQPTPGSDPSWFGFLMLVQPDAPFTRSQLVQHLERSRIQTRMLFAGNLTRHPCFDELRAQGNGYRVVGDLAVTDDVMTNAVWLGVYPGLRDTELAYMVERLTGFLDGGWQRSPAAPVPARACAVPC
ncbi:MAG: CDP-4-dehydro-6-deoxyglucose reductase [Acidimicrobiaceae bacterium]|nr:CDP-4-dehydro-6-deoxyglucose reductase [Acidimicrobiaceae bacterium]